MNDLSLQYDHMVHNLSNLDDGKLKVASEVGTGIILERVREQGFARSIIEPKMVSPDHCTKQFGKEDLVIIEEFESRTEGSKICAFDDAPDMATFRGNDFLIKFFTIQTPEFYKNVFDLMQYKNDFRQITVDHASKDMLAMEDTRFMAMSDACVGSEGQNNGLAGYEQNHLIEVENERRITRADYNDSISYLEDNDLTNGVFLMNQRSAKWFNNFDRNEMGGDLSQAVFRQGTEALQKFEVFGCRHLTTIKRHLVPNYVVYQYAPSNYLGRFYILQEPTMYVEKKKDIIRFNSEEKIGISVPNVAAIHRARFVTAVEAT